MGHMKDRHLLMVLSGEIHRIGCECQRCTRRRDEEALAGRKEVAGDPEADYKVVYRKAIGEPWKEVFCESLGAARGEFKRLRAFGYIGGVQFKRADGEWIGL